MEGYYQHPRTCSSICTNLRKTPVSLIKNFVEPFVGNFEAFPPKRTSMLQEQDLKGKVALVT
jgi:hypothetical protein